MNNFVHTLGLTDKKVFFKLKNTIQKITRAVAAADFNRNCIRENLCPRSIRVRHTGQRHNANSILKKRLQEAEDRLKEATKDKETLWSSFAVNQENTRSTATSLLEEYEQHQQWINNLRIQKKLTALHRGPVRNERPANGFTNLSSTTLSEDQEKLLNLGLNCHYIRRPHPESKRIEIENLIDQLLTLQEENKLSLSTTIREELIGEAGRERGNYRSQVLTPELKKAAKELRQREDIIIRKGDKSSIYVVLDKEEYLEKLDNILSNPSKFQHLQKDPTEAIKKKINNLINRANTTSKHFSRVIGDYGPGYCYGTVKTHKPGNPLRPIISQVTTPTYQVAKKLNNLITPYVPEGRSVKSATEFIDLLHTAPPCNDIASLDVESLFTNVPVMETINIILERIYRSDLPQLDIPEDVMRAMLETCTKEAPFLSHRGELYRQVDGVAMGSPLGVLFANMYMSAVEERTFQHNPPPGIYARYIDDIFITTINDEDVTRMINALQRNSCLAFTCEKSTEGRLPFLDVDIYKNEDHFKTKVFTKATNVGRCLNARGECPIQYKRSVVAAYIQRALTHCNSWADTHRELERVRQLLTNNGFPDGLIEKTIKEKLDKYAAPTNSIQQEKERIVIYYRCSYHNRYTEETEAIKGIIRRGAHPIKQDSNLHIRIFSKPNLTRSLFMRNSTAPRPQKEATTNVVYKFSCPESRCDDSIVYIGRTSSTLRRRLQYHRSQGAIFQHYTENHNMKPPLQKLIEHTEIMHKEQNFRKLQIAEAVSITLQHPTLNIQQFAEFTLPSIRPINRNQNRQIQVTFSDFNATASTNHRRGPTTRLATRMNSQPPNQVANQQPASRLSYLDTPGQPHI